jgi:hypothetical protein
MRSAHAQFTENLRRARELGGLAAAVEAMTTPAIDVSDLLRSQIVLAVSALDHFVHELARLGMIEISQGARAKTDGYLRFQMPVSAIESALSGVPHALWIGETVREKHSWQSFQDPDKIADAIRLILAIKLWEEVGLQLNMTSYDVKTQLKLVVDRRNKIAHEADIDPANPGFRWTINSTLVNDTIDFIERIGEAIYKVAI